MALRIPLDLVQVAGIITYGRFQYKQKKGNGTLKNQTVVNLLLNGRLPGIRTSVLAQERPPQSENPGGLFI
jgi:hypothetical protein